jgi:hypothetical protein
VEVRQAAVDALEAIGRDAVDAIPALEDHPNRREAHTNSQGTIVTVAQQDELFHFVTGGDHQGISAHLGEYPDARAIAKTARRVQRRFLGVKERLEPLEGVLILKGTILGADHAKNAIVGFATYCPVGDFGIRVGGDEGRQFDLPVKSRLRAGSLPIVEIAGFQGGAESVPRSFA